MDHLHTVIEHHSRTFPPPACVSFNEEEKKLNQRSNELFVEEEESTFEFLELGPKTTDDEFCGARFVQVDTTSAMETIEAYPQKRSLFFLSQEHSWSRLNICEDHFRKLCNHLHVHPRFLDVVHLFREKIAPVEESYGTFFAHVRDEGTAGFVGAFDLGYNLKYVAKHGRTYPSDPFAIREIGVYHSYSESDGKSSWILLQAPDDLKARLKHVLQVLDDSSPANLLCVHAVIILTLSQHWRDYLEYLEEQFSRIVDRGFFTSVKGAQTAGDITADFSDIRRLQILTDRLERLTQILQLNIRFSQRFYCAIEKPRFTQLVSAHTLLEDLQNNLENYQAEQETHLCRINSMLSRSQGIHRLVQAILDLRTTEASKQINVKMELLTEQGVKENQLMTRLTQRAAVDTRSMMVIALISAVFLPAMFLATLFGSNFFVFSQENNALVVASNFWIYALVTVCFSGITILCLYVWRRRTQRRISSHGISA